MRVEKREVFDEFYPVRLQLQNLEIFLNRHMRHTRGCRGSMPVFLTRRDPDNVTLPDFLDFTAPLLNPTRAGRHDKYLTERVGMPCRPGAGLKRDEGAGRA